MMKTEKTSENNVNIIEPPSKTLKTKDYVLRARRKYYNKRKNDEEFKDKLKAKLDRFRNKNRESYNEKQKIYTQRYRAKKKQEQQHKLEQDNPKKDTDINKSMLETIYKDSITLDKVEKRKLYMKEYYQKKKQEKLLKLQESCISNDNSISSVSIDNSINNIEPNIDNIMEKLKI